jgi:tRNA (guanosine-2'-O-)-methyltransferase
LQLPEFDLTKGKAALVFGSELPGISDIIINEADEFLKIPMSGFTESLNISVSAAVILYHLTDKIKKLPEVNWQLTPEERDEIKLHWLRNTLKRSTLLEKRFWEEYNSKNNPIK